MPRFTVHTTRIERITYEIEATDAQDAKSRYLMDGDETGSETSATTVDEIVHTEETP